MLPPSAKIQNAADTVPAKLLHSSLNKVKHPINVVKWTPEGRRLLTGSSIGEFTLWNGMGFNFETISQVDNAPYGDFVDLADITCRHTTAPYEQRHGHTVKIGSSLQSNMGL